MHVLRAAALAPFLARPFVVFVGLITLICFLATASIAVMNKSGNTKVPMKWHYILAKVSIALLFIYLFLVASMFC